MEQDVAQEMEVERRNWQHKTFPHSLMRSCTPIPIVLFWIGRSSSLSEKTFTGFGRDCEKAGRRKP